jgi:hypothetical protein
VEIPEKNFQKPTPRKQYQKAPPKNDRKKRQQDLGIGKISGSHLGRGSYDGEMWDLEKFWGLSHGGHSRSLIEGGLLWGRDKNFPVFLVGGSYWTEVWKLKKKI